MYSRGSPSERKVLPQERGKILCFLHKKYFMHVFTIQTSLLSAIQPDTPYKDVVEEVKKLCSLSCPTDKLATLGEGIKLLALYSVYSEFTAAESNEFYVQTILFQLS